MKIPDFKGEQSKCMKVMRLFGGRGLIYALNVALFLVLSNSVAWAGGGGTQYMSATTADPAQGLFIWQSLPVRSPIVVLSATLPVVVW